MPRDAMSALTTFQQTTLIFLRTVIGWHFLYEGYFKFRLPAWTPDGQPLAAWSSAGFIRAATGPLGRLARAVADTPGLLVWVDRLIVFGLLAVGISLILGLLTRAGCIGGLLLLATFYLTAIPTAGLPQTGAEGTYLIVNKTMIEGFAVLALMAFDTGKIAGIDRLWAERSTRLYPAPSLQRP
jgi:thiosulfate dehydrogenase (quinone) large subunit